MMKLHLKTLLFLITISLLFSCAGPKLRLGTEEITRPLSLPPRTWELGFGLYPGIEITQHSTFLTFSWDPHLQIPFLSLGDHWEMHLENLLAEYYVLKNTAIQDSILKINGLNLAVEASIFPIYLPKYGFFMYGTWGYELKNPLSRKVWLQSAGYLQYDTHNDLNGGISADIGYQITTRVAFRFGLGTGVSENLSVYYEWRSDSLISNIHFPRRSYFTLPINFVFNKNARFTTTFGINPGLYVPYNSNKPWYIIVPIIFSANWIL